jgi:protein-disulfide isomerase
MLVPLFRSVAFTTVLFAAFWSGPAVSQALSPEQKQQFEHMIHDYLVAHPEVVIEALEAERTRHAQERANAASAAVDARRDELLNDPNSPVGGNPKGSVTLVEFFDYRCPYCKKFEPELEALIKEEPDLRVVYKEFPILGPSSVIAARVALAARLQGKYDALHRAMLDLKGPVTTEAIFDTAQSVGINVDKVKSDMNSPDIGNIIKQNFALAEALRVQATPTFVLGKELLPGVVGKEKLRALIAGQHPHG